MQVVKCWTFTVRSSVLFTFSVIIIIMIKVCLHVVNTEMKTVTSSKIKDKTS